VEPLPGRRRTVVWNPSALPTWADAALLALPWHERYVPLTPPPLRPAHGPNILICESRGFWDTVATMTVQQNIERLRQFHLVPYGDEDGSRTIFGPQDCP